jgi:hypothetical protein
LFREARKTPTDTEPVTGTETSGLANAIEKSVMCTLIGSTDMVEPLIPATNIEKVAGIAAELDCRVTVNGETDPGERDKLVVERIAVRVLGTKRVINWTVPLNPLMETASRKTVAVCPGCIVTVGVKNGGIGAGGWMEKVEIASVSETV